MKAVFLGSGSLAVNTTGIICLYRDGEFLVPGDATHLRENDEVVLITHRDNLTTLNERFETPR